MNELVRSLERSGGVCVVAGEASGDVQAAHVVRSLRHLLTARGVTLPEDFFWGAAGPCLREAGVRALVPTEELAVMGFAEVMAVYPRIRKAYHTLQEAIARRKPAALVCVDYPGFNLRLIQEAYQRGVTVIYHIPPKVWAHGARRVELLRENTHLVTCILPFEECSLRTSGVNAVFVGNPLRDAVVRYRAQATVPQAGEPSEVHVGLLPGSRKSEIRRVLPLFVAALKKLQDTLAPALGIRASLPIAPTLEPTFVEQVALQATRELQLPDSWFAKSVQMVPGGMYEVLNSSHYAWVCSGTATLEAAFFETPMSAVYRMNSFSYEIARRLVKVPFISLVNLCAGKELVPEFLQDEATPERLAQHAAQLLTSQTHSEAMRTSLAQLASLFPDNSHERAAKAMLETIAEYSVPPELKFKLHRERWAELTHMQGEEVARG